MWIEESLVQIWNAHEIRFGQVAFMVPAEHPNGDVEQASGYTSLELRGVIQDENTDNA